jgi:hypothetical protein
MADSNRVRGAPPPGRGRGGGRGVPLGVARGAPPGRGRGGLGPPPTREERKEGKREKQKAAEAARDKAEDDYFRQCQAAALKSGEAQKATEGLSGQEADAHEQALFATQGSQGIQFDKYADIKVETSGPGADAAPPLTDFASLGLPQYLVRSRGSDRAHPRPSHCIRCTASLQLHSVLADDRRTVCAAHSCATLG